MRSIVQKVPNIEERISRHAAKRALVEVIQACQLPAEFDRVPSEDFGRDVLIRVGPLIQNAADTWAECFDLVASGRTKAADLINRVGRQSDWRLRIGSYFIPMPSRGINASFIQKTGRDGAIPDRRKCLIDLVVMEEIVLASRPIQRSRILWYPVDRKGNPIS